MSYLFTADQFVDKLLNIANNYKTLYVMGCFGAPMTDKNKIRYTTNHAYNKQAVRTQMIKSASSDTFGFDCVGLVKGVLWGWDGDVNRVYGGSGYAYNGVPDTDAKKMLNYCNNVSTDFRNIKKGEFIWLDGHCGVYGGLDQAGRHFVIECTPKWSNKVQVSYLANLGDTAGNCRTWTKHGELKWIDYSNVSNVATDPVKTEPKSDSSVVMYTVQAGDYLIKIARKFGVKWTDIVKLNAGKVKPPLYTIYKGQELRIK